MSEQRLQAINWSDPAVLQLPAASPPPGVTANFENPESRGFVLTIVGGILMALMILFLAARAYTKVYILRKMWWDDVTIALSATGAITTYIIFVWACLKGPVGKHQYDLHVGDIVNTHTSLIPNYIVDIMSSPILWLTKMTFFLLYLHLFWPMRWLRISVYIGAAVFTLVYLGLTIGFFALTTPRPGEFWPKEILSTGEYSKRLVVVGSAIGLATDIFLLVLPLAAVSKLQMHQKHKVGLMIVFSTGFIAIIACAVSVYYRSLNYNTTDDTWVLLNVDLTFLIEVCVGIITASMPAVACLTRHHLPSWETIRNRFSFSRFPFFSSTAKRLRSNSPTPATTTTTPKNRKARNAARSALRKLRTRGNKRGNTNNLADANIDNNNNDGPYIPLADLSQSSLTSPGPVASQTRSQLGADWAHPDDNPHAFGTRTTITGGPAEPGHVFPRDDVIYVTTEVEVTYESVADEPVSRRRGNRG